MEQLDSQFNAHIKESYAELKEWALKNRPPDPKKNKKKKKKKQKKPQKPT